jgi:hypothetical protein
MSAVVTSRSSWMPVRPRWREVAVVLACVAAAAGFLMLRASTDLPYPNFHGACERLRTSGVGVTPQDWFCRPVSWTTHDAYILSALLMAVGFVLPSVVLAATGRRLTALLPLLLVPATQFTSVLDSNRWWVGSWRTGSLEGKLAMALVLALPAVAVMLVHRERRSPPTAVPLVACAATWVAVALPAAGIVWLTDGMFERHYAVLGGGLSSIGMVVPAAIAIALFGSMLGIDRRWWPWSLVPVALLMSAGPASAIIIGPERLQDWSRFGAVVPLFAIGLIASTWRPLAERIGRRIRPVDIQPVSDAPAPLVTDPGRLRPTVVLNAVGAGMLLVSLVIFRADPLPDQIGTSLPTYLGARSSVEDLRTRQLLRQALTDMDAYRSEHGTYQGFDLAAAASLDPELTWQEGLPHSPDGPNIPELTMGIVGASSTTARIVAVSVSGTSICIQRDGNGIAYGSAPRIAWNTALPSALHHAVAACGSTPWTDAALRPFPIATMCADLDRDSGYLLCRMVQVIMTQTAERTGPV